MTILEKIRVNAERHPDRSAVITQTENGKLELSWSRLNILSDRLASYMVSALKTKTPVIVYGHKNPYMIVCFLACVKSGRAYCPLDINMPLSRIQAVINEVQPELILSTEPLDINDKRIKPLEEIKKISSKIEGKGYCQESDPVRAGDVFYIIFTSGSTGIPKGVQITRECLDNFIHWAVTLGSGVSGSGHHIFLNQAPFSFDLSVMDLYLSLYTGGTLFALTRGVQEDMRLLYKSLKESKAHVWVSTPSFADVCLSDPVFTEDLMPDLTDFLFCGEILTNKTAGRLSRRFPSAKIVNTYGPTESTCAVTEIVVTPGINAKFVPLPVGRPKNGTWVHITDKDGNNVPEGGRGEITIIGDSVSIGYWNNDDKNSKCFGVTTKNGREYRFYRTGDEGCIIDGILYYAGRMDNQVKLHGYRIELEDIESSLLKIKGIVQAVVVPKYRDGKAVRLAAGVVPAAPVEDEKAAIKKIKDALKQLLPEYMVPGKIKFVSDIPRTNNGKTDRKAVGGIL